MIGDARQDLETSLGLLEVDIEDMEDSVKAVEESGSRWGLSHGEVERRRRTLESIKADVKVRLGLCYGVLADLCSTPKCTRKCAIPFQKDSLRTLRPSI